MSVQVCFFQAEDGIRVGHVTGVETCALPISAAARRLRRQEPADQPQRGRQGQARGDRRHRRRGTAGAAAVTGAEQLPPATSTRHRHLFDLKNWSQDDVTALFATADVMGEVMQRTIKKVPALQGFTVGLLFFEDSTRTRLSFDRAARAQSADVITFSSGGSSLSKAESVRDTIETIDAMQADLYVIRHPAAGAPEQISRWTDAAIVNAGDGRRAHPTQALLDAYTFSRS